VQPGTRNIFTVVASPLLVQSLSEKSLLAQANNADKTAVVMGADESTLVARLFGVSLQQGRKLELIATGPSGPKFKAWMHRTRGGAVSLSDLVWTVREEGGKQEYRLALVAEYSSSAQPHLKAAFLLGQNGARQVTGQELILLRRFIDPRLGILTQQWGTGNDQLKSSGMRAIGLAEGIRSQGNGFIDQWARGIGLDFALSAP
jgi:hypothetical protein